MAAVGLSVAAFEAGPLWGDHAIIDAVQDSPFPGRDVARATRALGSTELIVAVGAGVAGWCWWRGLRSEALWLAAGLVLLPLAQAGLKELIDRPRPSPALVEQRVGFESMSFPAGHAMSPAFALLLVGLLLWPRWPRWARAAFAGGGIAFVAAQAYANLWLGAHWSTDLLGGWLWAVALALPLRWLALHGWESRRSTRS